MTGSSHGAYVSEARNHVNFNSGDQVKTITVDRNEILTVQSYTNTATTFKYVSITIERLAV